MLTRGALPAVLAGCLLCAGARAQRDSGTDTSHGAVQLEPTKSLREGIDLWPLVAHPKTAAEARVNRALGQWNTQLAEDVRRCDKDLVEKGFDPGGDSVSQNVTVRMNGPRFLSLVADRGYYCGGPHPDGFSIALVFDLQSGELINWKEWNPSISPDSTIPDPSDEDSAVSLSLPGLDSLYEANAMRECSDAFQHPQHFLLWLDVAKGAIVAEATGLPHVAAPCVSEFALSESQARALGFKQELLDAISTSKRVAPIKSSTARP